MGDLERTEPVDKLGRRNPHIVMTRQRAYREGRILPVALGAAIEPVSGKAFYFTYGPESSFPENSQGPVVSEHRRLKEEYSSTMSRGFQEELNYKLRDSDIIGPKLKKEIKYPTKSGREKRAFVEFYVAQVNPAWVTPNQTEIKAFDLKQLSDIEKLINEKQTPVSLIVPSQFIYDCIQETEYAISHFRNQLKSRAG
jgi:hypothetical protein